MAEIKKTPKNIVMASKDTPWEVDIEPFRVAPHIYYVGNLFVGSFLIETSEGLALIDSTMFETTYLLLEAIRKLGFDPKDIKKILLSHAHMDHDGGARCLKELTGAKIYLAKEDDEWRKKPEADMSGEGFKIIDYTVDEYYSDDTPIVMGDVVNRTRLTAGHTPGCTSFFVEVKDEDGKTLTWAMHGGVGTNTINTEYLNKVHLPLSLQQTFLKDCEDMKSIHVDICTPSHPSHSDMLKRVPADRRDYRPFIDTEKWAAFLDERAEFVRQVM